MYGLRKFQYIVSDLLVKQNCQRLPQEIQTLRG